jgi:hypothetical protein
VLVPGIAAGAELDLFVTDYSVNPTREQRPLIERPLTYARPREVTITTPDGATVTHRSPTKVTVQREGVGNPREARIFAAVGEYESFSFLLRPKETLAGVFITASALKGPAGNIPARNVVVTSVERFHGGGRDILMRLGKKWNMAAHSTEFFWCTVKVPDGAKPGIYRGEVIVTSKGVPVGAIPVVLDVLPIELADPPFALGFNYSSPKDQGALKAHLADMREHGMTTVAPLYKFHLPVHDSDTSELGNFIKAYREAGFPATLCFATPMNLHLSALAGYGSETTKRWQQKYIRAMRLLHAETQKHDMPVLMSIADELTNKGLEGVRIAENLAHFVWEELPEIATTSDMNGYREVMAMAPYLNVATFNNGWDGIDHHNKGRHLINKDFIRELQEKTGAIPWFVNADDQARRPRQGRVVLQPGQPPRLARPHERHDHLSNPGLRALARRHRRPQVSVQAGETHRRSKEVERGGRGGQEGRGAPQEHRRQHPGRLDGLPPRRRALPRGRLRPHGPRKGSGRRALQLDPSRRSRPDSGSTVRTPPKPMKGERRCAH